MLALLSHGPVSGYDIKKLFERYIGEFWSESYGQIYPVTKSLVDDGCATYTVERTQGKPDRHVVSITEKGMQELRDWLIQPMEPHRERLEVLLKLICAKHVPTELNLRIIKNFRDEWTKHLESYARIWADLCSEHEDDPYLPYWLMSVNCGLHLGNAYVDWCDETIAALRAMDSESPKEPSEQ